MPEHKKESGFEELARQVTTTPSSNEHIEAELADIRAQISGLTRPPVVVDGEPLAAITKGQTVPDVNAGKAGENLRFVESDSMRANASRSGLVILRNRARRMLKKAA